VRTAWDEEKARLGIEHLSDADAAPQLRAWVERPSNHDLYWLRSLCRESDRPLATLLAQAAPGQPIPEDTEPDEQPPGQAMATETD
jgi:hypothetical protein